MTKRNTFSTMTPALRFLFISVGLLVLWQLIVWLTKTPHFILPGPLRVFKVLWVQRTLIAEHSMVTMAEILLGMFLGCLMGFASAMLLQWSRTLSAWLLPVLIVSQAIPVFALAPILMLWFGYGMASKVVMAALIIFFPVTSACYDGLRRTPNDWIELAQTMQASKWQVLWQIRLPAALPSLASGLRVAAATAPIGAVIGEWVGSSQGLGYLMLHANARMQVDTVFAALIVLACLSLLLYFGVDYLLRRLIYWKS
ncbi:Riboflavin transport system permease protein RibX [Oligella sp. MSHR50489EDL]|uniref:ABC transporter permease n=1 Tax=Oligella sp. MSHR50489EDL TaxID=3139409 RepID=UPI003D815936